MLPDNRKSIVTLQRNLGVLLTRDLSPVDIIHNILLRWIKTNYPTLVRSIKVAKLIHEPELDAFLNAITELDLLTAAFWLTSTYAKLQGRAEQKLKALYFTPPYLSQRVLDNVGQDLFGGKLIDPACGGAAFLVPAAIRIADNLSKEGRSDEDILAYLEENIHGCDIDPFLCRLSSIFLKMALSKRIERAGRMPTFKIRTGNGLRVFDELVGTFTLVLCNPPYRKLQRAEAIPLYKEYGEVMKGGQPNIYSLFIGRSMQLLQEKGIAALLTPMSFLSGSYYSAVRRELCRMGRIHQFDLIWDKQGVFLGAEQDTVVTVWQKGYIGKSSKTKIYSLSISGDCKSSGETKIHKDSNGPWPIPKCLADVNLLALFEQRAFNLESYGYKPRTGAIVIHRDTRRRYGGPKEAKDAKHPIPMIWSMDIRPDGTLNLQMTSKRNVRFIDMETGENTSIVKGPSIALQRVTAPEQKRRLVCAPVPDSIRKRFGGLVGENHVCLIERVSCDSKISPEFLSAILRTEIVDRLFRCISGATNVSVYELMHLPLPDPKKVIKYIAAGLPMDDAVVCAFGLSKAPASVGRRKEELNTQLRRSKWQR